ncbi:hypothetical protein [Desulfobulbus propionicus]|jgi:hypothetical protein
MKIKNSTKELSRNQRFSQHKKNGESNHTQPRQWPTGRLVSDNADLIEIYHLPSVNIKNRHFRKKVPRTTSQRFGGGVTALCSRAWQGIFCTLAAKVVLFTASPFF